MATLQQPTPNYFRCMKYKRKFYEADDYLPRGSAEKSKVRDPDVKDIEPNPSGTNLTENTTMTTGFPGVPLDQNNVSPNAPSLGIVNDKIGLIVQNRTSSRPTDEPVRTSDMVQHNVPTNDMLCQSMAERPSCGRSLAEQTSILQALETPQSTQEICLTLLNMAFWRPDSENVTSDTRNNNENPIQPRSQYRNSVSQSNCVLDCSPHLAQHAHTQPSEISLEQPKLKRHCANIAHWKHSGDPKTGPQISPGGIPDALASTNNQQNQDSQVLPKVILLPLAVTTENNMGHKTTSNDLLPNLIADVRIPRENTSGLTNTISTPPQSGLPTQTEFPTMTVNPVVQTTDACNSSVHSSLESHVWSESTNLRPLSNIIQDTPRNLDCATSLHLKNFTQNVTPTAHVLPMTSSTAASFQTPVRRRSLGADSQGSDTDSTLTNISASSSQGSKTHVIDSPETHGQGQSGMKKPITLFPRPAKGRSLWEIVDTMARRHKEDYYIGWAAEKILELPPDERPNVFPVTPLLKKELVSKSVLTENKKLAFSFLSSEDWGHVFRHNLRHGVYKTLSDAKRDASQLWRDNCPDYDGSRAVRMRDNEGNIVMKRTRVHSGSEFEYRQNLRKAKVNMVVDQIWAKRTVISEALKTGNFERLVQEMQFEIEDYKLPDDRASQIADVVAFAVRKELLSSNLEKLA